MACSRWTGLRSGPSLDFTRCRRCASLWIGRCAHASHLIVISAVDLANCHSRRIGLAHRLQSGSIVGQKTLCVWRKVIEAAELGHHKPSGKIRFGPRTGFLGNSGVRASGHDGPMVGPPTVAGVHGDRWTGSRLPVLVPVLGREEWPCCRSRQADAGPNLNWRPICSLVKVVCLERAKKLAHTKPSSKGSWPRSTLELSFFLMRVDSEIHAARDAPGAGRRCQRRCLSFGASTILASGPTS